jgi:hypothetical protein
VLRRLGAFIVLVVVLAGCSSTDQVTVPNLHEKCVTDAYEQLRGLDLKVEIDGPIGVATNHCTRVGGHAPEAGNDVEAGSVVTLHPGVSPLGLLLVSEPDPVVLPDLIGVRLDIAVRRLDSLGLAWTTRGRSLPPPPASDAPTLLEHYRVTKMEPGPGEEHDQYTQRGNTTTTKPLTLWAALTR